MFAYDRPPFDVPLLTMIIFLLFTTPSVCFVCMACICLPLAHDFLLCLDCSR